MRIKASKAQITSKLKSMVTCFIVGVPDEKRTLLVMGEVRLLDGSDTEKLVTKPPTNDARIMMALETGMYQFIIVSLKVETVL